MADATILVDFKRFCCGRCGGISFINNDYHQQCMTQGGWWYCAYCGTKWGWEKGTESVETKQARIQAARAQRANDALVKLRDDICPCCDKSYMNVLEHLKRRHPEWTP